MSVKSQNCHSSFADKLGKKKKYKEHKAIQQELREECECTLFHKEEQVNEGQVSVFRAEQTATVEGTEQREEV